MKAEAEIFCSSFDVSLEGSPLLPRNCKSYERRIASHCPTPDGGWEGAASRFDAQARRPAVLPSTIPFRGKRRFYEGFYLFMFGSVSAYQCTRSRITGR